MTTSISNLAVLGLATYRVTKFILEDELASPVRNRIFKKFPPQSSKLGYLFTCSWCTSIWVGAGLVALDNASPLTGNAVKNILAASAITGLLDTRI
jgi:hypothetical protein